MNLTDLLMQVKLVKSKTEAKQIISNGGIYINNKRINDIFYNVTMNDVIDNKFIVLRKGKKDFMLLKIINHIRRPQRKKRNRTR